MKTRPSKTLAFIWKFAPITYSVLYHQQKVRDILQCKSYWGSWSSQGSSLKGFSLGSSVIKLYLGSSLIGSSLVFSVIGSFLRSSVIGSFLGSSMIGFFAIGYPLELSVIVSSSGSSEIGSSLESLVPVTTFLIKNYVLFC